MTSIYDVLRDQGSIIGGALAFVAGLLVYRAGNAQAKAVERQNDQLKLSDRRRLARTSLIAARMIDGVLSGMQDDIGREI